MAPPTRPRITPDQKKCGRCENIKPSAEFMTNKKVPSGLSSWCRQCNRAHVKEWNEKNPEKRSEGIRRSKLKRAYGITPEEWEELFDSQGRVCAICMSSKSGFSPSNFHVDHCHTTNVVRGILCGKCNVGLGHFRDEIATLERAIEYLRKYE